MDRRSFLRTLSVGLIGARYVDPTNLFASSPEESTILSIVRGDDVTLATTKALEPLGGMSSFVSRGDVVIVKPNIGWDRTPEQAANTNPHVVATLVRLAYDSGAKKVKVFDNTCNTARRCYKRSGIEEAARGAGADVFLVEERKFKTVDLGGEVLKEWLVYKDALEADKIINVPTLKHHTLARLTISMKNLMGLIGGARNLLHQKLDNSIVDLATFFKPTLTVLDAIRILTANGPQGGNLADVKIGNTIAASRDQVAIDAFGASLFGMTPDDFPHIREAHARGLGEKDLTKVKTIEQSLS
ncbi:MAG: DUF362 domain-containing protein [Candidatus Latescibacterota bacterium]|nr:MAG: DUF362 domain-containing protein [Candidatus Latescibacterota bacterium]